MGALLAATQARNEGVTAGTISKSNVAWKRWVEFMHTCELDDDIFLTQFTRHERHLLLGAFAQRVRDNEWSKSSKGYDHLVAGSCRAAIYGVCQAFVSAGYDDPGKDAYGKLAFVLQ
jgi:hypothetical protein